MKSASEKSGKSAASAKPGAREHTAPRSSPSPAPTSVPASEQAAAPVPPSAAPGLSPRHLQRLQAAAGNTAVSRLVAQRYAAPVKPPPSQAPGFRKVQSDVAAKKRKLAQHHPATAESRSAQDAAVAPPDDKEAQGKAANAEKMNAAKPGEFDKAGFIAAVNEAIAAQAPKNLDEADKFADSGKADKIKGEVDGKVTDGKQASSKDIETTTKAAPDTSKAKEKQVTPMGPDQPPANPGAPSAADATPQQQPPEVTDFSEGPKKTDQQMADADVTEEQLAKSNEPEFTEALGEKKKAEKHSATAPAQARGAEKQQLATAKSQAAAAGTQAMSALTATRAGAGKQVDGGKGEAKSKDEQKREEVTAKLQKVFDATQKDVEGILDGLDGKVDKQFEEGEKKARDAFNTDQKRRMKAYKDKRYGGFWGPAKWAKDKIAGMPEEANQLFQESRKLYVRLMQGVISSIADTIGTELGKAKARIAKGRAELKAEVDKLPADLKKYGQDAAKDFAGKFDDLESEVNDKSKQLVQTLAQKYTQALNKVDEEIKKLQEANKGLVQKAVDAVVGVIKTINELKNLLMGILAKAAGAIMKIIKDPIGFLGNLVRAVGAGLQQFISNIGTHLQTGLVSWLLGTSAKAGIETPAKFDLKGIIQLIASLLGLTWANIRARITRKGVPDQAMSAAEQSVPVAKALATEGPAGAAKEITVETGDLKSTILEELKSYLIPTVIIAGITWILSLLNPASAFVRAVKGIIDIVTFVVNQGAQIVEFVNAVLDAVVAIANGGAAGVPKTVETALAASLPLLIGLLASLLGIGGLANKIKQVFQKVSRPVNRAMDKIAAKIAQAAKRLWGKRNKNKKEGRNGEPSASAGGKAGKKDESRRKVREIISAVDVSEKFTTFGHVHTIRARGDGSGRLVTSLASEEEEFKAKVMRVKGEIESYPAPRKIRGVAPGDMADRLHTSVKTEERLKESFGAWKRKEEARTSPDPSAANKIKQIVDKWIADGRPEVVDASDIPKLPEGFNKHREMLYEGGGNHFNRAKIAVIGRDFPGIFAEVQAVIKPYKDARSAGMAPVGLRVVKALAVSKLKDMTMLGAAKEDAKVPVKVLMDFKRKGDVSTANMRKSSNWNVDHIVPLAAHWHAVGYNSADRERVNATPNISNLQLIAADANKSAQADYEGEKYEYMKKSPGPDFETEKEVWE
ncbi:GmrSD restriction endonuclease domain-containing protein [Streptomyces antimycoticus]|uniref:GmrSD restriction endonuclease domain-containing protein n=1 Tax=Streptomyces antimycoticus TaxID=68175 RepID=UPI0032ED9FF7